MADFGQKSAINCTLKTTGSIARKSRPVGRRGASHAWHRSHRQQRPACVAQDKAHSGEGFASKMWSNFALKSPWKFVLPWSYSSPLDSSSYADSLCDIFGKNTPNGRSQRPGKHHAPTRPAIRL